MNLRRFALLLLIAATGAAFADGGITGTWDAVVESALGSGSPTFVFKQEGEKLSGDYSGALGNAKLAGTVRGGAVEYSFTVEAGGDAINVQYKGKLSEDGKKIEGAVSFGSLGEGKFTATRR